MEEVAEVKGVGTGWCAGVKPPRGAGLVRVLLYFLPAAGTDDEVYYVVWMSSES